MVQKSVLIAVGLAALIGAGVLYWVHTHPSTKNGVKLLKTTDVPTPVYDLWVHW